MFDSLKRVIVFMDLNEHFFSAYFTSMQRIKKIQNFRPKTWTTRKT